MIYLLQQSVASVPPEAVPVAVHGFTWTSALVGLLNVLVGGVLVAVVRNVPALRKIKVEEDSSLRTDLMARIDHLEKQISDERRECDRELSTLRGEIKAMQDKMDGLIRQLVAYQVAEARLMPTSPQIERAVQSLEGKGKL